MVSGIWQKFGAEHNFIGLLQFYDYLVFISLYASLYIRDEETYNLQIKFHMQYPLFHIVLRPLLGMPSIKNPSSFYY